MLRSSSDTSAFGARHFGLVWMSGLVWHLTRWGVAFLGTFLVNEMTGSPRLVQLAGTLLYAPLLLGGLFGGVISDRFDRVRTVKVQLSVLIPLSLGIGILVRTDRAALWMIYLYMFVVGIGWITDMTCRRALIYDLVGERRIDHAMAMEALSLSLGMILGALVGGSAVAAVGVGSAYFFIAGLLVAALMLLLPLQVPAAAAVVPQTSPVKDLVAGVRALRAQRELVGVLGVTAIANFFLFAYFPIIPVIAERLGAAPFLVGLLSAGTGIGMMTGSLLMARLAPRRRGLFHVAGLVLALAFVVPFGRGTVYWFVLAALICSGVGSGLFGATQTTLVMAAAPAELRGRALGLLSMSIGALPVGMYALGEVAEQIGVSNALTFSALVGTVVLGLWVARRREVLALTGAPPEEAAAPVSGATTAR
jgi:MFS family permease